MATKLGDKIKKLRNERGLTLDELAEKTSSSKSYIWELENKSIGKPSAQKLSKVAEVLGVTTEYLLNSNKDVTVESAKDKNFFEKYKTLTPETKKKYMQLLEFIETDKKS